MAQPPLKRTVIVLIAALTYPAYGYDYTADLHRDCLQWGLNDKSMFGEPLCEVVKVERLTKAEAVKRGLSYRAVSWGKLFPADEDGYYLPASGEFIPQSWSVQSPDSDFHRCTYPLNNYWTGSKWTVQPDNSTGDGKPPTRCFWNPRP